MDQEAQRMFDQANNIVFLTGAGVSTPSGVPDYRSKHGLYAGENSGKPAEYYLSHSCLVNEPDTFYTFVKNNMYYPEAKPNAIHTKQAQLTNEGKASIVTQNVDDLYNEAHANNLVEFHGNLYNVYCEKCHKNVDWHEYMDSPTHKGCGGLLRPGIVLYDEGLNQQNIMRSVQMVQNSDLLVIVGSSMKVYPFAGLLQYRNPNAQVIAINKESLDFSFPFKMIQGDAVEFFKELKV